MPRNKYSLKINVLSDISWGSNDKTTILIDQTFILFKIQTQEEAQKNLDTSRYLKNENAIFNKNVIEYWKYIPHHKATRTAAVPVILYYRGQAIINKLAALTDSSSFSRSGTAAQPIIVGWSSSEFQTGNSSITLQK